jgi:hypothetical protein
MADGTGQATWLVKMTLGTGESMGLREFDGLLVVGWSFDVEAVFSKYGNCMIEIEW